MDIQGKQLTLSNSVKGTDVSQCIICQENTGEKLSSSENCRKRIRNRAEEIKESDAVYKRLKVLDGNARFVYHMNNSCYKKYTRSLSDKKNPVERRKIFML